MASDSTNSTSTNTVHTTLVRSTPPFTQAYRPPMFNYNYNHNWQPQPNPQTQPSQHTTQAQPTQEQLPPPPIHPPKQENQTTNSQPAALPTFGMIMPISGGSPWTSKTRDSAETTSGKSAASSPKVQPREPSGHTLRSPSPKKMSTSSATHTKMLWSSWQTFRAGGLARY